MVEDPITPDERVGGARRREAIVPPLLTPTELVVVQLLVLGYSPVQIASLIGIDRREVQAAAASASVRLGVTEWRAAAALLLRRGVIGPR